VEEELSLSEQAGICLMCACENPVNRIARLLLDRAGALTATGVVAAVFIASNKDRQELLMLARGAVAEQRDRCLRDGLFASDRCPDLVVARSKNGTEG
jgi:hypothetical protein